MNIAEKVKPESSGPLLLKPDANLPALIVTGRESIAVRAGVEFAGRAFLEQTDIPLSGLVAGVDYLVRIEGDIISATAFAGKFAPLDPFVLGGFHFAPGGNALARAGGDDIPAINPCSLWDVDFRPACPDPRGMALVEAPGGRFWCDIYLTGVDHLKNGTSCFDTAIADGENCPRAPDGKKFKRFDYAAAKAVMEAHGKGLLSFEEFVAAAFGVTEKSSVPRDPVKTALDAPRTSRFGLMQATGNLWVWGHDGDPDTPRASLFGGSWFSGADSGSRFADVATAWPDDSYGNLGARGRSDHLQPVL